MRAVVAALALLGWAGFAHALGLGEIEVRSRLNQPILAIIPISAAAGETDDLIVELAGNDEFERAGLERTEFLSSLRFEVQGDAIKVTSKQIAREPFVSFLLDVRWGGGRLMREYTVLLDPPTLAQAPRPAAPAPAAAPSATTASPTEAAPSEPMASAPEAAAPADAPETAPATAAAPVAAGGEGGTYGPTAPKETLWSIAYKLRPDPNTITMDQMQVAIFNANPSAFHGGSLTGLMKGVTLRIPPAEEIRAIDPAAAKSQVAAARSGAAAAAPAPVQQAAAPVPEYVPPPPPQEEPAPAPVETPPPPAETAPATAETPPATVTPPPEVAQAPVETPPAETAPAPVEQAPPPAPAPAPSESAAPAPTPAQSAPIQQEEPGMVAGLLEQARSITEQSWFYPAVAGFVVLIVLVIGGRKVADKVAKWRYDRASRKPQVEPVAVADTVIGNEDVTQVAEAPSMETALQEASSEAAAVPPMASTQTQAMPAVESTMQQTVQQTQVVEPSLAQSGKLDFDVTGSFASETVQINLDAGDPVSEAEFHRAYGLYDEAALLLKQALQKDPKRTDAKVKLAEIYFEASKKNEFVDVARELKGSLPDAEWQKIALLGSQIAPENELFAGGASAAGGTVDLSFDEPAAPAAAPAAAPPAAPAPAAPAQDLGLDFKLEDVQLPSAPAAPAAPAPAPEPGLEFDLGSLSLDVPAAAPEATVAVPAAEASPATEKLDLGDFDLNAPAAGPGGGDVVELSADMTPAAGGDESSTKLDLARAYIDMGDSDMAKSLLNEVAQQGNPDQQKEAQELLKRVSG